MRSSSNNKKIFGQNLEELQQYPAFIDQILEIINTKCNFYSKFLILQEKKN